MKGFRPGKRLLLAFILVAVVATQFVAAGHEHAQHERAACGLCLQLDRTSSPPPALANAVPETACGADYFPPADCAPLTAEVPHLPPLRGPPAIRI